MRVLFQRSYEGNTAAHYAVVNNNCEVLSLLQLKRALMNIRNCDGKCAIDYASDSTIERIVDDVRGEPAVTHFERLAVCNGFSLAAVRLETGRTHQIRVHMKHIGHPLPGDFLYHPDYSRIARQALHSYKLSFLHPITKQPMVFTAPIPEDMQALLSDDAHTG